MLSELLAKNKNRVKATKQEKKSKLDKPKEYLTSVRKNINSINDEAVRHSS